MSKFKVGDPVRVTKKTGSCDLKVGDECTVSHVREDVLSLEYNGFDHSDCWRSENTVELIGDPMDNLKQGDVLVKNNNDDRIVQGVIGEIVLYKYAKGDCSFDIVSELKEAGWHLKDSTPTKELTIDEIAEKLNLKPEQVRIKKED